ncbi:fibrillarin-like rRNA/tRNA 2'-O-methyltransferase [Candidatus Woesearchaeota archaeon]|nr:fibrillarin-like rRNA/tRNA 2'-O-methyltransferase [Candidatus Woesearchaeota archaeon]
MQPERTAFPGIFRLWLGKRGLMVTRNLVPGASVYGEQLIRTDSGECRAWDPKRSKLAAAVLNGLNQLGLQEGALVLYLGASTGTTVSHVSDIVGPKGIVFAVESAPRVCRELVFLAEQRQNVHPILADANHPERYADRVLGADFLYQDIAQRAQVEIFLKNVRQFLKPGGFCVLCVKARSIDVTKRPQQLFREVRAALERELIVADVRDLAPFQADHAFFVCKRR